MASVTKATDGHVGEQGGREVVTHGVEDPDDGLAGPDGIVERVAGHAVGRLEDAGDQQRGGAERERREE